MQWVFEQKFPLQEQLLPSQQSSHLPFLDYQIYRLMKKESKGKFRFRGVKEWVLMALLISMILFVIYIS